ncbi:DUF3800 domain-containing protein [uncultured Tateyamaria sp.]|uniref:DUF3800 domain-containing protein n=1 Tax=uncultured Tateyamaria sp. TaxID=455651 RepID=UPI00260DE9A9|nr:DUF3800 domain-containing protein [uncultured Tateyamaria sp.]
MSVSKFYAYIDEAGDEGFGKLKTARCGGQSRWFALGAILVSDQNDKCLPQWRDEALQIFENKKRDLHFNKSKHEQKVALARLLAEKPFGISVICSDKIEITNLRADLYAKYKEKGHLYNYLTRFLLERLTTACANKAKLSGTQAQLEVTFSRRAGTDYSVMRDYLFLMRDGKEKLPPVRSVDWSVLNPEDIKVENHSKRAGLQLADVVTSATYAGLEPNLYGDVETRYARSFARRFLKEGNSLSNCGVTVVPRKSAQKDIPTDLITELERCAGPRSPDPRR